MSDEFEGVQKLFKDAEDKLKIIERITSEVVVPSINELRYAGFHLLRYLRRKEKKDLEQAENHCKRALYDAHEFHITYCLNSIRKFDDDYRLVLISPVVKNYVELIGEVNAAREFIATKLREHGDRQDLYAECEEHASKLEAIDATFKNARPELNKSLEDKRILSWRFMVGILAAAVIALATLVLRTFF